jgi:hypothetical protein
VRRAPEIQLRPPPSRRKSLHHRPRDSLADNRAAGLRLTLLLIALSCLLAVTSACIWYALSLPEEPLAPERVAVMSLLHLWPVIPALALVWRWSRSRLFGTLLL